VSQKHFNLSLFTRESSYWFSAS